MATAHSWLALEHLDLAPGPPIPALSSLRDKYGFVPNLFRAQAQLPRLIEAEYALISAILFTDKALIRAQKECILLAVSASRGNRYCFGLHSQTLKLLGVTEARLDRISIDFRQADLSPATTALIGYALKLNECGKSVSQEDIVRAASQGLTEEAILEATLTVALGQMLCVLATGIDAVPDFESIPMPSAVQLLPSDCVSPSNGAPLPGFYLRAPEMHPEEFAPFGFLNDEFGYIPSVFRAQTARPDVVEAQTLAIQSVLMPEDALTRSQKESILFAGGASRGRPTDSERALLGFAKKLASGDRAFSSNDTIALRERGFTGPQILETVVTAALSSFFQVLQSGLGAVPDFAHWAPPPHSDLPPRAEIANLSSPERDLKSASRPLDPDLDCVARIQSGNLDSFEELMNRHSQRVYRTLIGILRDPDEARDATQDTFLKAFQHLSEFQGRSKFSTWLLTIAANTGLQRLRSRRPMESLDDSRPEEEAFRPRQVQAWADDPEQEFSKTEIRSLIEDGLMTLPPKYRIVVMLRDIEQLSAEEASSALGLGIPALKSRLMRGRLMLREALAPHFAAVPTFARTAKRVTE